MSSQLRWIAWPLVPTTCEVWDCRWENGVPPFTLYYDRDVREPELVTNQSSHNFYFYVKDDSKLPVTLVITDSTGTWAKRNVGWVRPCTNTSNTDPATPTFTASGMKSTYSAPGSMTEKADPREIAGGVIGGLCGIVIAGIVVFLWYRSRRKRASAASREFDLAEREEGTYIAPIPFDAPKAAMPSSAVTTSFTPGPGLSDKQLEAAAVLAALESSSEKSTPWGSSSNASSSAGLIPPTPAVTPGVPDTTALGATRTTRPGPTSASAPRLDWEEALPDPAEEVRPDHAEDAGRIASSSSQLPPMYNPAWREEDDP